MLALLAGVAALSGSSGTAVTWQRRIAVANAAGPTGLAALRLLRDRRANDESCATLEVCAICRDDAEVQACRQAVCGAVVRDGVVRDICDASFPSLRTIDALSLQHSQDDDSLLCDALRGYTTLLLCLDEIHPVLAPLPGAVGDSADELIATMPFPWSSEMSRCEEQSLRLIDAAASVGVQHVILHSALGASDFAGAEAGTPTSLLQMARMGGEQHLSLRRRLEERVESYSRREHPTLPLMRHTILQAAPYASAEQLADRRLRERSAALASRGSDAENADDDDEAARRSSPWLDRSPPITTPESLAHAAVEAALYTRPNTLKRKVKRRVTCEGTPSWTPCS